MPRIPQHLKLLLIVLMVLGGVYYASFWFLKEPPHTPGVTQLMSSQKTAKTSFELKVLFIGNSYTFYNNLAGTLIKVADSDPDNSIHFVVQSVTRGGIGLKELWDDGDAVRAIRSQKWDYVVLQEQSFWAMFPDSVLTNLRVSRLFDAEIKNAHAKTLLFLTWARQPGSFWYSDPTYSFLRSADYMQSQFDIKTQYLAERLGAVVIPVGDYWASTLSQQPAIPLYAGDGTHPSTAGTYLSALVFYRYFSNRNAEHIRFVPEGISADQAEALRHVVRW